MMLMLGGYGANAMKPIHTCCCFSSGGEAADSLLERAMCYVLLAQRKTAIFDFSAILKEHPTHVQALCGRGFTYLTLNQKKVFLRTRCDFG